MVGSSSQFPRPRVLTRSAAALLAMRPSPRRGRVTVPVPSVVVVRQRFGQQHESAACLRRIPSRPSVAMIGTMASAASGSAHHQPITSYNLYLTRNTTSYSLLIVTAYTAYNLLIARCESMPRSSRDPGLVALKRRQLDAKIKSNTSAPAPKGGWIRASREALGMSSVQLGRRLGVSQQEAADLERRERAGSISIATLEKAAAALGCDLKVTFVPRTSFEAIAREQAAAKARAERNRVVHTMRLEAQEKGVEAVLDDDAAVDAWLTRRLPHLWD